MKHFPPDLRVLTSGVLYELGAFGALSALGSTVNFFGTPGDHMVYQIVCSVLTQFLVKPGSPDAVASFNPSDTSYKGC